MIYHEDTSNFFDEYYDEIEELREEWVEQTGQQLNISGDLKDYLTWFAFVETAVKIRREAGWE